MRRTFARRHPRVLSPSDAEAPLGNTLDSLATTQSPLGPKPVWCPPKYTPRATVAVTSEDTRESILGAALEAFGDQGFAAVSIRNLASRLGISSAALYYHFPSKLALLEPYLDEVAALLARFPPAEMTEARKPELLAGYLDIVLGSPDVADLVGRERALDGHPELGPRMTELVEGTLARLAAPGGDDAARVRATAAIGALRRPVLRPEIDATRQTEELLDAALAARGGADLHPGSSDGGWC